VENRVAGRGHPGPVRRYVLLPHHGLRWPGGHRRLEAELARAGTAPQVLDTLVGSEPGAALVTFPTGGADAVRRLAPDLQLAPVQLYRPALARPEVLVRPSRSGVGRVLEVTVLSTVDGRALGGVAISAFIDFAARCGTQAVTRADGTARLAVGPATVVERLYAHGAIGHWSLLRRRVPVEHTVRLALRPFAHEVPDGLTLRYGATRLTVGRGVRIALIDTGVAADHPDLVVNGGRNCVTGEDPAAIGPNGHEHGTHVAGIVAARGRAPSGRRGVAPGVDLRSYRVFAQGRTEATNFAIAKALDAATGDGCDVVNLSLGGGEADPVVRAAIEEAQLEGVIVVAAAGNDGRAPVGFPASLSDVVAGSALGRTGTFPPSAAGAAERRGPYGNDGADFVAAFSNVGAIDLIAPGVAIVSTVPGGYLDLDGTSMACPAIAGVAARILSGSRRLRSQPRSPERAAAVLAALHRRARSLGFPTSLEGDGLAR
jgi:subtilisin